MQVAGPLHYRLSNVTCIAAPPRRLEEFFSWTCSSPLVRQAAIKAIKGILTMRAGGGAARRPSAECGPEEPNPISQRL